MCLVSTHCMHTCCNMKMEVEKSQHWRPAMIETLADLVQLIKHGFTCHNTTTLSWLDNQVSSFLADDGHKKLV